jgi:tetratricopeptide (TPR) repeat protein
MKRANLSLPVFGLLICSALPGSSQSTTRPGASCLDPNSPDKTITRCTQIINRGSQELPLNLAAAYKHRGDAYFFNGKIDYAISDLTQAIRLNPNAETYKSRAAAYYQKGDLDHAKADWAQARRLEPAKQ